ncbi:hypothetical protein HID58_039742, partial [Brassica napus]
MSLTSCLLPFPQSSTAPLASTCCCHLAASFSSFPHETVVSEAAAPASAPHVANSMGSASAAPPVANMAFASCNSQSKAFQEVILSSLLPYTIKLISVHWFTDSKGLSSFLLQFRH